jgi:hypothetical protein
MPARAGPTDYTPGVAGDAVGVAARSPDRRGDVCLSEPHDCTRLASTHGVCRTHGQAPCEREESGSAQQGVSGERIERVDIVPDGRAMHPGCQESGISYAEHTASTNPGTHMTQTNAQTRIRSSPTSARHAQNPAKSAPTSLFFGGWSSHYLDGALHPADLRKHTNLVARGGVEPPTYRFSGGRSYQLSYLAPERERAPRRRATQRPVRTERS